MESNIQKPRLCRLAIVSPLLIIFAILIMLALTFLPKTTDANQEEMNDFIAGIVILMSFSSLVASFIAGIMAILDIRKSRGLLKGRFIAWLGAILSLLGMLSMMQC